HPQWVDRAALAALADADDAAHPESQGVGVHARALARFIQRLAARLVARLARLVDGERGAIDVVGPAGHQRVDGGADTGDVAHRHLDGVAGLVTGDQGGAVLRVPVLRVQVDAGGADVPFGDAGLVLLRQHPTTPPHVCLLVRPGL